MENKKNIFILIAVVLIIVFGLIWLKSTEPTEEEMVTERGEIISENGIHWHPELEIYLKGEQIQIPENIGLIGLHSPIHTHDDLPIIHLEFSSVVRENDTRLGEFFKVWNKDFMEFGEIVKMTVNGEENSEFENYLMRDGDKIELHYE
ncbi:MAG: hypothetical protein R3B39_02615 [Candidatus Paceibacterota bacterium]